MEFKNNDEKPSTISQPEKQAVHYILHNLLSVN